MEKVRVVCMALAGLAMTAVVPASADPITIASGAVNVGGFARGAFRGTSFSLTDGDSFSMSGGNSDGHAQPSLPPCAQFGPCSAGATTNPSNTYALPGAYGSVTLNGNSHDALFQGGSFTFSGGNVVLPPTTADMFDLRSSFLFEGLASIWVLDSGAPTFFGDFSLAGHGTAITHLQRFGDGYAISGFTYEFQNETPSPTPEPASMLLLGTGLVAAWQTRRLRRQAANG